jgi:uncharacterized protein (DUF2141 family)
MMNPRRSLAATALLALATTAIWVSAPLAQGGNQTAQGGQGRGGRAADAGQARDAAQAAAPQGTAMILGSVVNGDTGTPVRRARVTLNGTELRGNRATVTDDEGNFVFTQLPAGRYSMTASKAGYVNIAYGAKAPGRAGTPMQVEEGQRVQAKPINLPKGGVITGVVLDEYGEPSPGTPVRALRSVMRTGERRLESAGTSTTDDRGIYRIYGLQPGQFVVTAQPRNTGLSILQTSIASEIENAVQQMQSALGRGAGAGQGGRAGGRGGQLGDLLAGVGGGRGQDMLAQLQQQLDPDGQPSMGYAPVFFPGTTSPSAASFVDVTVGQERFGVDFQLRLVATAQVSGVLTGTDSAVPAGAQVTLTAIDTIPGLPGSSQSVRANQAGAFSFRNVTPGQYRITSRAQVREAVAPSETPVETTARGGRGGQGGRGRAMLGPVVEVLWAQADISVDGRDLEGVSLSLQRGMVVSGQVAFDGTTLMPPDDLTRMRVTLNPVGTQDAEFGGPMNTTVDANGRFTINGVPPGRYMLRSSAPAGTGGPGVGRGGATTPGGSGNWVLRSAVAGGRDTLDFPLQIEPNTSVTDAVITFSDKTTELTGLVQDSQGQATADYTIIVFATDQQYWTPQARRIQSVRPGTDGRYTVRNLPPGDYAIAAVTDVEPGEWYNPAFLQELASASLRMSLAPGDRKTQDIRLAGGGQ